MSKKRLTCDENKSLHSKTLDLFINRPRTFTLEKIEDETRIPISWLATFPNVDNPSVNRVETLYTFLSGVSLFVE